MTFLTIITVSILVQTMAVVGTFHFVEPFDFCYERDENIQNNGLSKAETKANYYNFKAAVLSMDEDSVLIDNYENDNTKVVLKELKTIQCTAYQCTILCIGLAICLAIYWGVVRHYVFLKDLVKASLITPIIFLVIGAVWNRQLIWGMVTAIFGNNYTVLFSGDNQILSVLPAGIFLCHLLAYVLIWMLLTVAIYGIYMVKRKHRKPHVF